MGIFPTRGTKMGFRAASLPGPISPPFAPLATNTRSTHSILILIIPNLSKLIPGQNRFFLCIAFLPAADYCPATVCPSRHYATLVHLHRHGCLGLEAALPCSSCPGRSACPARSDPHPKAAPGPSTFRRASPPRVGLPAGRSGAVLVGTASVGTHPRRGCIKQ